MSWSYFLIKKFTSFPVLMECKSIIIQFFQIVRAHSLFPEAPQPLREKEFSASFFPRDTDRILNRERTAMEKTQWVCLGIFISALTAGTPLAQASGLPELMAIAKGQSITDTWPDYNDPIIFDSRYIYNHAQLMTRPEARVSDDKMPWSDTWWPSQSGGVANRWQLGPEFPYFWPADYRTEQKRIMSMSPEDLKQLSPAEKYDIAVGDYTFSLTREVIASTTPAAPIWWGICEGWTGAALSHPEPAPVTIMNPDGIIVEFGSSDVKGLLAVFYAWEGLKKSTQLGLRCGRKLGWRTDYGDCYDVHPAALHIVLLNQIGFMNAPFAADVDGDGYGGGTHEVWNQPVFAYKTTVLEEISCRTGWCDYVAPGTVRQVRMETLMTFADDDRPLWNPTLGTPDFFQETRRYEYWLELDRKGNIIGGSWITAQRPDFLWILPPSEFTGMFAGLKDIYQPSPHKPYCVPQRYIDDSDYDPSIPIYPVSPVCVE
jgi:hypothetical protein